MLLVVACESGHPITYDNQTSHVIRVYIDGQLDVTLKPGERVTEAALEFRHRTWRALDESDRVIFEQRLTDDQMNDLHWTLTFDG